jgi:hypothetical protein
MENKIKKAINPKALFKNIVGLSILLIGGYFVLQLVNPYEKELAIINNPNSIQLTNKIPINAKVNSVISDRGVSFIKLDNSKDIFIQHSRNYDYEEPWLNKFLQVGDYLLKNKNSDTLRIKRGADKYYFVIGEFINENE